MSFVPTCKIFSKNMVFFNCMYVNLNLFFFTGFPVLHTTNHEWSPSLVDYLIVEAELLKTTHFPKALEILLQRMVGKWKINIFLCIFQLETQSHIWFWIWKNALDSKRRGKEPLNSNCRAVKKTSKSERTCKNKLLIRNVVKKTS